MPPGFLGHAARRYTELGGCRGLNEGQVFLIVGCVVHGLAAQDAAIADEMGQETQPVLRPAEADRDGLRIAARDSDATASG